MHSPTFLQYKPRFFTCCLLFAYAYAHTHITVIYIDAQLHDLMYGVARLPFAQRLLVPYLARAIHTILPISLSDLFFLLEWMFTSFFYFALKRLLGEFFKPSLTQGLSWLFLLLLPLVTLINYRYGFSQNGDGALFYPYDTSTLFFIAMGYWYCLTTRWAPFLVTLFFATLNRESSILLLALLPALHWHNPKVWVKPTLLACIVFISARSLVIWATWGLPGHLMECLPDRTAEASYFALNLHWLFSLTYFPVMVLSMAGLPFLWVAFYDFIPPRFRPLRYPISFYFIGLLFCGIFMEARIFSEITLLLYPPVCLALERWFSGQDAFVSTNNSWLDYLNRWSIIGMFLCVLVLQYPINQFVIKFL